MTEIMLIYDLGGKDSRRISLNRRLFNYQVQSHSGKYKRKSKGILKEYRKPTRSVVIFQKKDLSDVKKLLDEFTVDYQLYEINQIK